MITNGRVSARSRGWRGPSRLTAIVPSVLYQQEFWDSLYLRSNIDHRERRLVRAARPRFFDARVSRPTRRDDAMSPWPSPASPAQVEEGDELLLKRLRLAQEHFERLRKLHNAQFGDQALNRPVGQAPN